MNVIENRLKAILSDSKNVATEVLQLCEEQHASEKISLNLPLQIELKNRLATDKHEEDVWDVLLPKMLPEEISEDVLNHLIQNNVSLLTLCHMQLQDKWLKKLVVFDDAPLYTLAKRYYLLEKYSLLEFLQFYNQYLWNRDDVSMHLLDLYRVADKRGLLIFLCSKNNDFENKNMLHWYQIADRVRALTNSAEITAVYKAYQNIGVVLTEIASNYFTSEEILLELLSMRGLTHANKIRKNSENTLKLKRELQSIISRRQGERVSVDGANDDNP